MSGILSRLLGSAAAAAITDAYFNLVTLLLNTTATNGAQNNTFLDSSTNNFSITRNGNTTQGTFTPFSQTGWSNYFPDSSYLAVTTVNTAMQLAGGNFTIEFWASFAGKTTTQVFNSYGLEGSPNYSYEIYYTASTLHWNYSTTGSNLSDVSFGAFTPVDGVWYHIALVRNSSTVTLYVNGAAMPTTQNIGTDVIYYPGTSGAFRIGTQATDYFKGYISNYRLVKGTAVYTSNFTPSTTPLTAITNTSLLTCQSNRFIDNSTNAFTVTPAGTSAASVQAFSPFLPTTAYSTTTVGGSSYFDGTGDYLSGASNTNLDFGTGDFTVEMFVYVIAYPGSSISLFAGGGSGGGSNINLYVGTNGYVGATFDGAGEDAATSAGAIQQNNWQHVALVRSGNNFTIYINGVSAATGSTTNASTFYGGSGWFIGANGAGANQYLNGYVSSVRVLKGTALYTTTFTPPTAPLTAITNTQLLISATNAGIFDSPSKNVLETVGSAQVSTTVSKWGTTSMYCPATNGNYFLSPFNQPNFVFGTGNFTVEAWLYPTAFTNNAASPFGYGVNGGGGATWWNLEFNTSGTGVWIDADAGRFTASSNLSLNTWTHVAVVRTNTAVTLYYNGVSVGTTATISNITGSATSRLCVMTGTQDIGGRQFIGYIDDLRITKGYARYTTTFTPPTEAFPVQ